ncbi:MAG: trypsin-like peptidase domain-containing protein [Oscillospiraceae bacterium]|nr:trypsin-like peptidase domain-containing protein [Oscillospiraceae bacterium]
MDNNNNFSGYGYDDAQNAALPAPVLPDLTPQTPPKRNASVVVVSLLCVLLVVVGGTAGFFGIRYFAGQTQTPPVVTQPGGGSDSPHMQLAVTPDGDRSAPAVEGGMTPVEIAESLKRSNVAVQIHGTRGNNIIGEGSGIIIHENTAGTHTYVVTAAHVIEGTNRRVSIELYNGESFYAEIIGYDARTDVGLLRIPAAGLHAATFGDSDALRVGEPVFAVGNPGGIQFMGSFTQGIVSAIDRPIRNRHTMITIQHTAPISPGNSGGALVNALGQVIGINSQKIVDLYFEGMGFAVPSSTVQEVVNNLIEMGRVPNRPKLGIQFIVATQTAPGAFVVRANNLPSGSIIIAAIDDDSDFTNTQVQPEDIITHVNGNPINRPEVLLEVIETGSVGQALELTIARVNRENFNVTDTFEVTVRLVEDRSVFESEPEPTRPWFWD